MDTLLRLFQDWTPVIPPVVVKMIQDKGGLSAIRHNHSLLREIEAKFESSTETGQTEASREIISVCDQAATHTDQLTPSAERTRNERRSKRAPSSVGDLERELSESFEDALKDNMAAFNQKFQLRHDQVLEELNKFTKLMQEQGDRVVSEINKGPHDMIRHEVG